MTSLPSSVFPDFVPNQILTDTQLNDLRVHLDQQDRRARLRLAGTGIVCGLSWRREEQGSRCQITVEPGFGLTSAGHLVEVHESLELRRFSSYTLPAPAAGEDDPAEALRGTARQPIELFELLTEGGDGDLTTDFCKGSVLLLFLESKAVDLRSCLVTDCNNKGQNIETQVRVLLAKGSPEELERYRIPPCDPPPPTPRLPRLHAKRPLPQMAAAADIDAAWGGLIESWAQHLDRAITESFDRFAPYLELDAADLQRVLDRIRQLWDHARGLGRAPQEHYEALRLFAQAHREWAAAACELLGACAPPSGFELHLMLGHLPADDGSAVEGFRHLFVPSPRHDAEHGRVEDARKLFGRLVAMAGAFDDEAGGDLDTGFALRLVPSRQEDRPLGERAAPRYFPFTKDGAPTGIRRLWQPAGCCTVDPLWSYHDQGAGGLDQINVDYQRADLIRIEGHRGRPCSEVEELLIAKRADLNLEFDLLVADFQPASDDEAALLRRQLAEQVEQLRRQAVEIRRTAMEKIFATGELQPVLDGRRSYEEKRSEMVDTWWRWGDLALTRRACCLHRRLQDDYSGARTEVLCLLRGLRGELVKVSREDLELMEAPNAAATAAIAGRGGFGAGFELATEALLLSRRDDHNDYRFAVTTLIQVMEGSFKGLPWLFVLLFHQALVDAVDDVITFMPEDLRRFSWPLFDAAYSRFTSSATAAWLFLRDLWQTIRTLDPTYPHGPGRGLDDSLLAVLSACPHLRLGTAAAAWAAEPACRADGRWNFAKLARRRPGLEHLAGVPKGGTFVLVCDDDIVTADFALHGRIERCRHRRQPDVCLPLVARTDHAVFVLRQADSGFAPIVDGVIDLLANDFEPNQLRPQHSMELILESDQSDRGAHLVQDGGTVLYSFERPEQGLDHFTYKLKSSGRCPAETTGEVVVLLTPRLELETGTVRGTLSISGDPLSGKPVRLSDGSLTQSGDDGSYAFLEREPGHYTVTALDQRRSGELTPGGVLVLDFTIGDAPQPGKIVGLVKDPDGAIPGAEVKLVELDQSAITGPEGRFAFVAVAPGTYTVKASLDGFFSASETVAVFSGQSSQVELTLGIRFDGWEARIKVVDDRTGLPVSGAAVKLDVAPVGRSTGPDGLVSFTVLSRESVTATVQAPGYQTGSLVIEFAGGITQTPIVRLKPAATIGRLVVDIELPAIDHVGEEIDIFTGPLTPTISIDDSDGRELLSKEAPEKTLVELEPGEYAVWANAPGYDAMSETVALSAGESLPLAFTLNRTEWTPEVESFVEWIARRQRIEPAEAQRKAFVVLGRRREAQERQLQALVARVRGRTEPASSIAARGFFSKLQQPVLSPEQLVEGHEQATASLGTAVPRASTERRSDFWSMLTVCNYGFLDRLTIQNPAGLDAELEQKVIAMAARTQGLIASIEADPRRRRLRSALYVEAWKAGDLTETLGLESPSQIQELMATGAPP